MISKYIDIGKDNRILPVAQKAMIKIGYDLFLFLINQAPPSSKTITSSNKNLIVRYEDLLTSIFKHNYSTSNPTTYVFDSFHRLSDFSRLYPQVNASTLEFLLKRISQFLTSVQKTAYAMIKDHKREQINVWDIIWIINSLFHQDLPYTSFQVPLQSAMSLSALVSSGEFLNQDSALTTAINLMTDPKLLGTCDICGVRCPAISCKICGSISCSSHLKIENDHSVFHSFVICTNCAQGCSFCEKSLLEENDPNKSQILICSSCGRKACSKCSTKLAECEECGNLICTTCQNICSQCDGLYCTSCADSAFLVCDICKKQLCNECQPNLAHCEWCKRILCLSCDSKGEYCKVCGSYLCLKCNQDDVNLCNFCVEETTSDIERLKADLKDNPDCVQKRMVYAALLSKLGETQKAIDQLNKASQLDPTSVSIWIELGDQYLQTQDKEEALRTYRKARNLAPFSPSVLKRIAMIYFDDDEPQKAKELLEIAYQTSPKNFDVVRSLAAVEEALNNPEKAIERLNEATEIKSDDETIWYDLGLINQKYGFLKEASNAYQKALEIDPTDTASWNNLGIVHGALDNKQAAIRCFRLAVALDDNDDFLWNNLGTTYASAGQQSRALDCFFRALEIDKTHVPTLYNLAMTWMDLGNHDEAIEILNDALKIGPNSVILLDALARAHREMGELEQASKFDKLVLKHKKDSKIE
ncbi:MAG: tetratricopeptide repeat protein [Candidatus Hodarchaeota archaeon]